MNETREQAGGTRAVRIEPLGDAAALVVLGEGTGGEILQQVLGLAQGLEASRAEGIEDIVPAYNTIAVFYDPLRLGKGGRPPFDEVCSWVEARAASAGRIAEGFAWMRF